MSVVRRIQIGENHKSAEVLNRPTDDILTLSGQTPGATFAGFATTPALAAEATARGAGDTALDGRVTANTASIATNTAGIATNAAGLAAEAVARAAGDSATGNPTMASALAAAQAVGVLRVTNGASGTNLLSGSATLVAGTVTVNNTRITAATLVLLGAAHGTLTSLGTLKETARVVGTSFTITSTNAADTCTVDYLLIEPVATPYTRPTLIPCGDSITGNGSSNSPGVPNGYYDAGFWSWANVQGGSPFDIPYVAGNAGNTSTQILALFPTQVLARQPSAVTIMAGTNDTPGTYTTTIANLKSMFDACVAAGIYVFACGVLPRPLVGNPQWSDIAAVNAWCADYWATHTGGEYVNLYAAIASGAAGQAVLPNTLADNVHPTNYGAQLLGTVLAPRLAARARGTQLTAVTTEDVTVTPGSTQLWKNPLSTTTGGALNPGITGTVPLGWGVNRQVGSPSAVVSLVARADGIGFDVVLAITATAAFDELNIQCAQPASYAAVGGAVGDRQYVEAAITVDPNPVNLKGVEMFVQAGAASGCLQPNGTVSGFAIGGFSGVYRSPQGVYATGNCYVRIAVKFAGAGSATVRIGRASFRRVP